MGYVCDGEAGFRAALDDILATMDAPRYRRQVEAVRQARDSRLPRSCRRIPGDRAAPVWRLVGPTAGGPAEPAAGAA